MFTLTWITEKELERVIENKGDEFRRKKNMEIQIAPLRPPLAAMFLISL